MNNELYHYNHNHDPRSGRFTFSSGPRSSIRKANRIDAQSNEYYSKFVKHRQKADRIDNKIITAQSKNPNSRKSKRLEKKWSNQMHKAYQYDRLADIGYAEANKIVRDLTDRGYNVKIDEDAFKRKGMSFTDFAVLQNTGFLAYRNYKKLNKNVNKYRI